MKEDVKAFRLTRLSELRSDRFGGSSAALAAAIRRSPSQVSQWFTGVRTITEDSARHIEKALRLQRGWLDAAHLPDQVEAEVVPGAMHPPALRRRNLIPVVGGARLGDNGHFVELEYPVGHGDGYVDFPSDDPNAYALRCEGDSMAPRIRSGEYVIVEPNREVQYGDEVVVKAADGRVMVKELAYRRDGVVTLLSVNDSHPRITIAEADIKAMHYVVARVGRSRWVTG